MRTSSNQWRTELLNLLYHVIATGEPATIVCVSEAQATYWEHELSKSPWILAEARMHTHSGPIRCFMDEFSDNPKKTILKNETITWTVEISKNP